MTDTAGNIPKTEQETLRELLTLRGIAFHHATGVQKLKLLLAEDDAKHAQKQAAVPDEAGETDGQRRARLVKEANLLVRVIVRCHNPIKKEWEGEILSSGNSIVPTVKKYIPFDNEAGYHVPKILINMMEDKQFRRKSKTKRGKDSDSVANDARSGGMAKEYTIEYLEPLTGAEIIQLQTDQLQRSAVNPT